jgi:hypothetical protein
MARPWPSSVRRICDAHRLRPRLARTGSLAAPRLSLAQIGRLTFEAPDDDRFPLLKLARRGVKAGGSAPAVFNAANETAVRAFLDRRIGFLDIATRYRKRSSRVTATGLDSGRVKARWNRPWVDRQCPPAGVDHPPTRPAA